MSNVFGFSTEPSAGGDFTPIIKYDVMYGLIFRIDQIQTFYETASALIDITTSFVAVMDFENIEVGWIDFPVNSAPSFVMVPMGQALPGRPSDKHKNGVRILLKLAAPCGGCAARSRNWQRGESFSRRHRSRLTSNFRATSPSTLGNCRCCHWCRPRW